MEKPHFRYTSFRVGGKIFASAPPEQDFLHVFVSEEDRGRWQVLKPRDVEKLFWGAKAVGLLFGYLYWRYHLESAMIAHALAHVVGAVAIQWQ